MLLSLSNASQSRSTLVLFVSVCVNVAYGTPASPCKDAAPVFRRAPIIEGEYRTC